MNKVQVQKNPKAYLNLEMLKNGSILTYRAYKAAGGNDDYTEKYEHYANFKVLASISFHIFYYKKVFAFLGFESFIG